MTENPTVSAVVLAVDCPDPHRLAGFYAELLGASIVRADDDWVQLGPAVGITLAFQLAPDHRPPQWPGAEHPQQMHLDLDVADLDAGERRVLALGARRHDHQPAPDSFVVYLDPAGHPFCLCRE